MKRETNAHAIGAVINHLIEEVIRADRLYTVESGNNPTVHIRLLEVDTCRRIEAIRLGSSNVRDLEVKDRRAV